MNDYGMLAEMLKSSGHAEEKLSVILERQDFDPAAFFEEVKAHIIQEVEKANVELQKRRLAPIERVLVPCYLGKLCLTYGTILMCCVEFDATRERITSVIVGPPSRKEISRKEYPLHRVLLKRDDSLARRVSDNAVSRGPAAVASETVSEIIETGIRLNQKRTQPIERPPVPLDEPHFAEFWTSLASLLRSYTALHGLHVNRQANVDQGPQQITVRNGEKWLILKRHSAIVTWTRENGKSGALEFTEHGTLRSDAADEAMDLAAEQWARELMHTEPLVQIEN